MNRRILILCAATDGCFAITALVCSGVLAGIVFATACLVLLGIGLSLEQK